MKKILGLPEDTVVLATTSAPDEQLFTGAFDLVIEHQDIIENSSMCMPMSVLPLKNDDGEFIGWEDTSRIWGIED